MENPEKPYSRSWLIRIYFIALAVISAFLAGFNIRALHYDDDECEIRLPSWLVTGGVLLLIIALPIFIMEICLWKQLGGPRCGFVYRVFLFTSIALVTIWSFVGLLITTKTDTECYDDFNRGFDTLNVTIAIILLALGFSIPLYALSKYFGWFEESEGYQQVS